MTRETFQIVADKVLAYGRTQAIDFAGMGEPTLNPNLPRFIEYFRGKIPTLITTNVSALTPRNIEKLIEAGLSTMIVSFNGADAATYELMMGGLSFECADRYLADLVQRAKGRMNVVANVSVTKQTRGKLNDIRRYLNDMGVEQITFSLCHNRGGHLKGDGVCDTPIPPASIKRCDIFDYTLFVAWTGEVLACCHDLDGVGKIGNLLTDPLEEIVRYKEGLRGRGAIFPMCANCNDLYRFSGEAQIAGRPVGEWVYALHANQSELAGMYVEALRQRDAPVQAYEAQARQCRAEAEQYRQQLAEAQSRLQSAGTARAAGGIAGERLRTRPLHTADAGAEAGNPTHQRAHPGAMTTVIEFSQVSKVFRLQRDRPRSFQEMFVRALGRNHNHAAEEFWALRNVSFQIEAGDHVGLIGKNGAGKSTTLKLISRIIQPIYGAIKVNGRVTALLELGAGFHPDLSGRDNIYLNGAVMGLTRRQIERKLDEIIEFAEIDEFVDVPVKDYSSGMYLRLAFAAAAHLDPEILLLDEVFAVGDQAFQQKSQERIQELRKRGITILFVSHSMEAVLQTCKRAIWLERGRVRAFGDVSAVSAAYYEDTLVKMAAKQNATSPAAAEQSLADQEKRLGSGEARIERLEFIDADGRKTRFTHTNAKLTVRLHYVAHERIAQPLIGIAFYRVGQYIHLAGPNNGMQPYKIPYIEGRGYLDYVIERLPFLPGEYALDASIYDWDETHRYDYWNECARFTVLPGGTRERYGLIALEGTWHDPREGLNGLSGSQAHPLGALATNHRQLR